MENRALLAFALSMAVFFLYMQFFGPKPVPPKPAPAAGSAAPVTTTAAAPAPAALAAAQPSAAPSPAAATRAEDKAVVLSNALVAATVSTNRSLEHWVLNDYRATPDKGALPVDLADAAVDDSHLSLSLTSEATAAFAVQGESPRAVTFVSAGAGALTESRTWRLGDGYTAELDWSAVNRGSAALVIQPTIVMAEDLDYETMSRYDLHGPIVSLGEKIERPGKKDIAKAPTYNGVRYAGFDNKYFLKAVVVPEAVRDAGVSLSETPGTGTRSLVGVRLSYPQQTVAPGERWSTTLRVYYGPKVASTLTSAGGKLETSIDYGFFGFLARPLLSLLKLFHGWVKNYGVAIILVTILIKLLFYPLTAKSFTAMKDMQRVQPKLEEIKKKYANDKERLNKEMMDLYRTEGINPLGGCLPMLLQIPVFFALYQVLLNSIELRHAPFMFWVTDLSAPEHLFSLHLFGFELPFRLLPLVMGVTMVLQQKLTPSTMDKAQQQIMMIMPVMFTFLFWGFPAGLVLYWLVNNVISIGQQWYITRGAAKPA